MASEKIKIPAGYKSLSDYLAVLRLNVKTLKGPAKLGFSPERRQQLIEQCEASIAKVSKAVE